MGCHMAYKKKVIFLNFKRLVFDVCILSDIHARLYVSADCVMVQYECKID